MRVVKPTPGPRQEIKPNPSPFITPTMTKPLDEVAPKVWRVRPAELHELFSWLIPRLRTDYPKMSEEGVCSWIQSAMADRRSLVVRTENIVGLFSIEENVFDPNTPYIIERFVRSREKSPEEAVNLYTYIRDYASSIKCSRIELAHDTDVQVTAVYPKLGDLSRNFWAPERESYYLMKLGRKAG